MFARGMYVSLRVSMSGGRARTYAHKHEHARACKEITPPTAMVCSDSQVKSAMRRGRPPSAARRRSRQAGLLLRSRSNIDSS